MIVRFSANIMKQVRTNLLRFFLSLMGCQLAQNWNACRSAAHTPSQALDSGTWLQSPQLSDGLISFCRACCRLQSAVLPADAMPEGAEEAPECPMKARPKRCMRSFRVLMHAFPRIGPLGRKD